MSCWSITVLLDQTATQFKLDTGAAVTAITEETFRTLQNVSLKKASKVLYGPARQELKVLGQFVGELGHKQKSTREEIYVVRGLKTNLLGLPAISSLQLIQRVCSTEGELRDIKKQFPKVFNGLGTLGGEYEIKLKGDARPYALYAPRNVPIPLCPKVQEEWRRWGSLKRYPSPLPGVQGW